MKILFLTDNFPPERNAPASRTYEHAREWANGGHDVTVITTAPNFPMGKVFDGYHNVWRSESTLDGIRVVRVKSFICANEGFIKRTLDYMSFMATGTLEALRQPMPDILVTTSPQFFCAVAGWVVSRVRSMPWVFELRDLWPESIVAVGAMKHGIVIKALEALELHMYKKADRIVSVTESFKDNLIDRGIDEDKIDVVLNGVNLNLFQPRERNSELEAEWGLRGKFVVGYLGTLGMAHGLDKVLDSAALLMDHPDIVFMIAGAGARRDFLANEIGTRQLSNVKLLPSQPRERMPDVWSVQDAALISLQNSDLFRTVIPSKIFEAMGMGIPMIVSLPEGETTRLVSKLGSGVTVPPENPKALADEILRLKGDNEAMQAMSKAGLNAAQQFSRVSQAGKMLTSLQRASAG